MPRHTSSTRSIEIVNANRGAPLTAKNNSRYEGVYSWLTILVWLLSFGLVMRRFSGASTENMTVNPIKGVILPAESPESSYEGVFPGLVPLIVTSALTYQTACSARGLLCSLPFWMATQVAGQSSDVTTAVPEFLVNSNTAGKQQNAAVASLTNGDFVVVWDGDQAGNPNIYAQRYALNGSMLGSEFRVNTNINISVSHQKPKVSSASTGDWMVVWERYQTESNLDIYAKRYALNGSMLGSEFRVNSNIRASQFESEVASLSTGEWVVVWRSDHIQPGESLIYAQRYAVNGSAVGSEFQVSNNTPPISEVQPAVLSVNNEEWVVIWSSHKGTNDHIYAQRYALNGSMLGSEFQLSSAETHGQFSPAPARLSTGGWVVVWQGQGGNEVIITDIYAQRYAANGSALESEFRVNSIVNSGMIPTQSNPTVCSLSNGTWIVVWDSRQPGDIDIYAQRYAANGSAWGSEFRVNSMMRFDQSYPAVASLRSGDWVVVWQGTQTGESNIYAAIFSSTQQLISTSLSTTAGLALPTTVNSAATTKTSSMNSSDWSLGTNAASGVSGAVIAAVAGVAGIAVVACLGAIGFYTYHKRLGGMQSNPAIIDEGAGSSMKGVTDPDARTEDSLQHSVKELTELEIPTGAVERGKELGRGGFGIVYEGRWHGKMVAVKTLNVGEFSENMQNEFLKEAKTMSALRFPNVVQLYGICIDETPYALVMEYMEGGSLYALLHSSKELPWETRLTMMMDIGRGLSYLHSKKIIHRDLKSLNVLLTKENEAKLSDFGLSVVKSMASQVTHQKGVVGSICWMSPELFNRGGKHDEATDVYSYGMVMWEIASRQIPYQEAKGNTDLIMQWIKNGETEQRPEGTPDVVWEMIARCWDKSPVKRPAAEAVVDKLTDAGDKKVALNKMTTTMQNTGFFSVKGNSGASEGASSSAQATNSSNTDFLEMFSFKDNFASDNIALG